MPAPSPADPARPRDVGAILSRPPVRPSPGVPVSLEARRAIDLADKVLASVRRALAAGPGPAPPRARVAPPPPEDPDTWLAPVLAGDYDALGRLVVSPGWLVPPRAGRPETLIPPAAATPEAPAEGGFARDAAGTWHILEAAPPRLRAAFAAPPRIVAGDDIPRALAELAAEPAWRPSPRVRATRIHEPPPLARCTLAPHGGGAPLPAGMNPDGAPPPCYGAPRRTSSSVSPACFRPAAGAPGWLTLDARYRAGDHELTLAEVLGAAGARYLRRGDEFIGVPRGPLAEAGARGMEMTHFRAIYPPLAGEGRLDDTDPCHLRAPDGAVSLPALAALRAIAAEPAAAGAPVGWASGGEGAGASAPAPAGYTGTLRPHQRAGLDWLWALRRAGLGGVLADEMGVGKTHVALAFLAAVAEHDPGGLPSLVVAPTSVVDPWIEKARAFAPGLTLVPYLGTPRERAALRRTLGPGRVLVTSYGILVNDRDRLAGIAFDVAILDEAQRVKNPGTEVAAAARALSARTRLALTGTPIENRPAEIRALLEFVLPGYLPDPFAFAALERAVLAGDPAALDRLRKLLQPLKLRRLKRDVLPDLPLKLEETRACDLSDDQAAIYREVLAAARADLRAGAGLAALLGALTRLKRVCDHPALVLPFGRGRALRSGKLDVFLDVLDEALAGGKKVVVFTQYLEMMDLVEERLSARGVRFADLRGSTRDRPAEIRRFQDDPDCRVIAVSLLAGGTGIDLTSATVVIHYDRWWNAAREDQATDRVHRIGQTRDVSVVRLVTRGTLEERIDRIIAEKRALLDDVIGADDPRAAKTLDRGEIAALLEAA